MATEPPDMEGRLQSTIATLQYALPRGTCKGEHGIRQGKAKYLGPDLGCGALAMMRAIKRVVDPAAIMDPAGSSR